MKAKPSNATNMNGKPLQWFIERIGKPIYRTWHNGNTIAITAMNSETATMLYKYEREGLAQYRDQP